MRRHYVPQHRSPFGFVVLLLVTCSAAAGAPPPRAATDPRLQQRITLRMTSPPLVETLSQLRRRTGVHLTSEPGLAKRRLVLLAQDRPLVEVLRQLAGLVPTAPGTALWERGARGGAYTYRLTEDLLSKNARKGLQEKRYREVKARLAEAVAMSRMSSEQLAAMREKRPRLVANMPRQLLQVMGSLPPEQLEQVCRGAQLNLAFGSLNSEQQGILKGMAGNVSFSADGQVLYRGSTDYSKSRLAVGLSGTPDRPGVRGMVWMTPGFANGCPNLLEPPLPQASDRPPWLRELLAKEDAQRKRARPRAVPTDPFLRQRVNIRRWVKAPEGEPSPGTERACSMADALRQIEAQTGVPVVADYDPGFSDYYGRQSMRSLKSDLVNVALHDALDTMAATWDLSWETKEGWLRVRSPRAAWSMLGEVDLSPPWENVQKPPLAGGAR